MYIVHFDDKVKLSGQDGSFLTQACWVQNSELFPAEFIFWIANAFFTTHLRKKSLPISFGISFIFNHTTLAY